MRWLGVVDNCSLALLVSIWYRSAEGHSLEDLGSFPLLQILVRQIVSNSVANCLLTIHYGEYMHKTFSDWT